MQEFISRKFRMTLVPMAIRPVYFTVNDVFSRFKKQVFKKVSLLIFINVVKIMLPLSSKVNHTFGA